MNCPVCKEETLIPTFYEEVEIDICKSCRGVWLNHGEIEQIVQNRVTEFSEADKKLAVSLTFSGIPESEKNKDRACPTCDKDLRPINYAVKSGIIIDTCPGGHGVWLDCNELEKIQEYREYWQDNAFQKEQSLLNLLKDSETPEEEVSNSILFNLAAYIGTKL